MRFFMKQLEKVLSPAARKQIPTVLGIDANGVVGSVESESVGAVNASNESLNGLMLSIDVSSVHFEIGKQPGPAVPVVGGESISLLCHGLILRRSQDARWTDP